MGDSRRHRGPHPEDGALFSKSAVAVLRDAVEDLSWLRSRGYSETAALKLVGDRFQLRARQRTAVGRCACSDAARERRASTRSEPDEVRGRALAIDGLNVVTSVEVALAGGALFMARDGCVRDMASFHGSYRIVEETGPAVDMLVDVVDGLNPSSAVVYIDQPVSNSGRLAAIVRASAAAKGSVVEARTEPAVDELLKNSDAIIATADSAILDRCSDWLNLARLVIERHRATLEPLWMLDLT